EGELALRLLLGDNLVLEEDEAGVGDPRSVGRGVGAAEEHGHAEPLLDDFASAANEGVRQEEAAGPEPVRHSTEERVEVLARDVKEDVEGDNGVERLGRKGERAHVGGDERRLRQALARQRDLRLGKVDAGDVRALSEDARRFDRRAAAELEHIWSEW